MNVTQTAFGNSNINKLFAGHTEEVEEKKDPLGRDAFLTMLVAQLRNQDPLNPMEGGEIFIGTNSQGIKPPIEVMLQKWVEKINAPTVPTKIFESDGVEKVTYSPGIKGTELLFCMVKKLGHYWAGGKTQLPEWIAGSRENLNAIDATKEIWEFFKTHPKK